MSRFLKLCTIDIHWYWYVFSNDVHNHSYFKTYYWILLQFLEAFQLTQMFEVFVWREREPTESIQTVMEGELLNQYIQYATYKSGFV